MTDGLLPPFGEPVGDRVDDARVLAVFLTGEPALVHSPLMHLEGATLVGDGDVAVAMRLAPRTFLLRTELPPAVQPVSDSLQGALGEAGITRLDQESPLAAAVAIQVLGIRMAMWDLWGADIDEAFHELRTAAAGEWSDMFPAGPPVVPGPGPLD